MTTRFMIAGGILALCLSVSASSAQNPNQNRKKNTFKPIPYPITQLLKGNLEITQTTPAFGSFGQFGLILEEINRKSRSGDRTVILCAAHIDFDGIPGMRSQCYQITD